MEVSLVTGGTKHTLETVRVLHETVLALRSALEGSRKELSELRSRFQADNLNEDNKRNENQLLQQQLQNGGKELSKELMLTVSNPMENNNNDEGRKGGTEPDGDDKSEEADEDVFETISQQEQQEKLDSEAESEDIDDIELVFTTAGTEPGPINEAMVPIREEPTVNSYHHHHHRSLLRTVIVETDISKCGVVDENEALLTSRRNTLPDPTLPYRPIVHREIMAASRVVPVRSSPCRASHVRPVLANKASTRQETGAQTDITALPAQWKSETYLAHKISYNLTTLPSKFTLPVPRTTHQQIPLSDKTHEARRVLLSDINFTSMVPELSRSADHLHQEEDSVQGLCKNYPGAFDYMKSFDVGRDGRSPRAERCCEFARHGSRSSWGSHYGSRCQASNTSITPFVCELEPRRRHSWRPPGMPCCHARHVWSSMPSSPTRCHMSHSTIHASDGHWGSTNISKKTKSKVTFHHCNPAIHPGQSLPDLRLDHDSGESTDSLVDEAEEFLRHSIDSMMIGRTGRRRGRRHSDPDPVCGFEPPKSAQPFLPKVPRDLKHDYLVKVITGEGRVVVGRVRYSGLVTGRTEPHVGVQLPTDSGISDGTFLGHRYFDCDPDHAIFVPFKKVVLAWTI